MHLIFFSEATSLRLLVMRGPNLYLVWLMSKSGPAWK